ncbi:MAG: hypothetical protein KDD06_09680 [Phaeodactylibacter sp.]|nr:hypothetical protein [Phaeodactylibacter sp.]MCB9266634.1 hypothetical protein [Lewinellaceae bacterium]MCB9290308.1 hypothetical protein [Lewinellaceae bacterium]
MKYLNALLFTLLAFNSGLAQESAGLFFGMNTRILTSVSKERLSGLDYQREYGTDAGFVFNYQVPDSRWFFWGTATYTTLKWSFVNDYSLVFPDRWAPGQEFTSRVNGQWLQIPLEEGIIHSYSDRFIGIRGGISFDFIQGKASLFLFPFAEANVYLNTLYSSADGIIAGTANTLQDKRTRWEAYQDITLVIGSGLGLRTYLSEKVHLSFMPVLEWQQDGPLIGSNSKGFFDLGLNLAVMYQLFEYEYVWE